MKKTADFEGGSPEKSLDRELNLLRRTLRKVVATYELRLAGTIARAREAFVGECTKKLSSERRRDFGEMLGLLRRLQVKPDKARRRDLKRIETVIDELREITESW